jgi:hypothetical protein
MTDMMKQGAEDFQRMVEASKSVVEVNTRFFRELTEKMDASRSEIFTVLVETAERLSKVRSVKDMIDVQNEMMRVVSGRILEQSNDMLSHLFKSWSESMKSVVSKA